MFLMKEVYSKKLRCKLYSQKKKKEEFFIAKRFCTPSLINMSLTFYLKKFHRFKTFEQKLFLSSWKPITT